VPVSTRLGAPVLRAAVEVVAEFVNSKAFARAFVAVVYERLQVRDGKSNLFKNKPTSTSCPRARLR